MRHEARQVPSWLIFDVRQKFISYPMKTPLHIVIAICSAAIVGAAVVKLYDVSFTPN